MRVRRAGNVRSGASTRAVPTSECLCFLTPQVANAAYAEQAEDVAATAVGLRDEELHVEDVAVRILPQPAEPHGAAATFDLVRMRRGEELARESWSVSMRFSFLPQIPAELVVRNPMGIVISFLQGHRIVTSGEGR